MIKCKECGSEVSSKADACPQCGFRLKAKPSGCIVGFFKLIGGIIGAIIGLVFTLSFFSNEKPISTTRQLEIRCEEGSKTQSTDSEQRAFYDNCLAGGMAVIKAQERINAEGK